MPRRMLMRDKGDRRLSATDIDKEMSLGQSDDVCA
jgi:hypothetical protein